MCELAIDLRPTQALGLWHAATLAQLSLVGPDITIRQLGILLHIYLAPPPHTVRGLAAKLGVTKPVIDQRRWIRWETVVWFDGCVMNEIGAMS